MAKEAFVLQDARAKQPAGGFVAGRLVAKRQRSGHEQEVQAVLVAEVHLDGRPLSHGRRAHLLSHAQARGCAFPSSALEFVGLTARQPDRPPSGRKSFEIRKPAAVVLSAFDLYRLDRLPMDEELQVLVLDVAAQLAVRQGISAAVIRAHAVILVFAGRNKMKRSISYMPFDLLCASCSHTVASTAPSRR